MAAVIRVKRRIDESPQNAFVLKKRKTDDHSNNPQNYSLLSNNCETNTILKFAGTLNSQDDSITSHISKLTKEEAKTITSKKRVPTNPTVRSREETKQSSQENRFKIVNCYRALSENQGDESKSITVVDVESNTPADDDVSPLCSSPTSTRQRQDDASISANNFVYDLYFADNNDLTEMDTNLVNDLVSLHAFDDIESRLSDHYTDSDHSEDSNSESNWRNDYPDEDDYEDGGESIDEDDMVRAVNNLEFDDESSDEDSLYSEDVNRYGSAYAKYKKKLSNRNEYYDGVIDDDGDYISDLSEEGKDSD
ncbi:putative RNA polymerase II nuclear localization protein SLC7A6OS [Pseudolycoriella hygida]|uniref:Probable RNA polymerase II nuclear localization protein SLC7A6OS n=1 Tax=Pseudolycoriella hygida TaxID=35572 RepID=A0A9Q0SA38_9DIPT|nr:putative RNA polymerase II nuclear localization protein SLC7A6OS [Pseudolycoriella hygida]